MEDSISCTGKNFMGQWQLCCECMDSLAVMPQPLYVIKGRSFEIKNPIVCPKCGETYTRITFLTGIPVGPQVVNILTEDSTYPCKACGKDIPGEELRCPHCGEINLRCPRCGSGDVKKTGGLLKALFASSANGVEYVCESCAQEFRSMSR